MDGWGDKEMDRTERQMMKRNEEQMEGEMRNIKGHMGWRGAKKKR